MTYLVIPHVVTGDARTVDHNWSVQQVPDRFRTVKLSTKGGDWAVGPTYFATVPCAVRCLQPDGATIYATNTEIMRAHGNSVYSYMMMLS